MYIEKYVDINFNYICPRCKKRKENIMLKYYVTVFVIPTIYIEVCEECFFRLCDIFEDVARSNYLSSLSDDEYVVGSIGNGFEVYCYKAKNEYQCICKKGEVGELVFCVRYVINNKVECTEEEKEVMREAEKKKRAEEFKRKKRELIEEKTKEIKNDIKNGKYKYSKETSVEIKITEEELRAITDNTPINVPSYRYEFNDKQMFLCESCFNEMLDLMMVLANRLNKSITPYEHSYFYFGKEKIKSKEEEQQEYDDE